MPQEEVSSDTTRSNDPYIQIGIRITNDAIRAIQNSTVSQTVIMSEIYLREPICGK
ncbi:MAG: hypothetical protein JST88_10275 [Bacteroidetes bacterium]|nr:hypothetical protein [Bacteroidota bacterium]